jgi:hypothetical protein
MNPDVDLVLHPGGLPPDESPLRSFPAEVGDSDYRGSGGGVVFVQPSLHLTQPTSFGF